MPLAKRCYMAGLLILGTMASKRSIHVYLALGKQLESPIPRHQENPNTARFYEPLDHCDGQYNASFSILSASTIIITTITIIYCGFCCHHYRARNIIIQYVWCVQHGYVCQQNTLTYYDILRNKKSCVRIIHHVLQFRSCNSIDIVPKAIQMMSDIIIKNTNNYVAIGRVWKISKILKEDPRRSSAPARPTSPVRPLSWTAAVWASVTVTRPSGGPGRRWKKPMDLA